MLDDFVGDDCNGQSHVLVSFHGSVEVEIFKIDAHEFGARGAENAVEHEFGSGEIGSGTSDIAVVLNSVATGSPADAFGVGFLRAVSADDSDVGGLLVFGDLVAMDEKQGISASRHCGLRSQSLEESTDLLRVGASPMCAVAAFDQFA